MNFGEKLASLRKQKNLTQSELGKELNISAQAVSKWENQLSEPDMETLKKLATFFDISVNDLITDTTTTVSNNNEQSQPAKEDEVVQPKIIVGYCDGCKKPIYQNEKYEVHRHGRTAVQTILCSACELKRKKETAQNSYYEARGEFKKGTIWGIVAAAIFFIAGLITAIVTKKYALVLPLSVVGAYGMFGFISQIIWGNFIDDIFEFFIRTFQLPGVIFSLDINGIVFLILFKVIGSLVMGLLSALLFVMGCVFCMIVSIFSYPFALINERKNINALGSEMKKYK